jgi:hypothetical protein
MGGCGCDHCSNPACWDLDDDFEDDEFADDGENDEHIPA